MANRHWIIGVLALVAIISSSIGLYLFVRDPDSEAEIHRLTSSTYNSRRPGGARLSGASYASAAAPNTADLGKAQVLLLRSADSKAHQRLQGRIYLAAGEWRKFIEVADDPASQITDGATVNNLGVALLALSDADPGLLLKALDTFERARQLDPNAPEPLFNLVVTYRKLRFSKLATEMVGPVRGR